jgi:hypothetical protein
VYEEDRSSQIDENCCLDEAAGGGKSPVASPAQKDKLISDLEKQLSKLKDQVWNHRKTNNELRKVNLELRIKIREISNQHEKEVDQL